MLAKLFLKTTLREKTLNQNPFNDPLTESKNIQALKLSLKTSGTIMSLVYFSLDQKHNIILNHSSNVKSN